MFDRLEIGREVGSVAELGCGYGTFTIPVARRVTGGVFAFDIEPLMVEHTKRRAADEGLDNIQAEVRDLFAEGFGLSDDGCAACLLFNILHCEEPVAILREASRVIHPGGRVLVIHWRSDVPTPRGPPLAIRPRAAQIQAWARAAGLTPADPVELPPWHFGLTLTK